VLPNVPAVGKRARSVLVAGIVTLSACSASEGTATPPKPTTSGTSPSATGRLARPTTTAPSTSTSTSTSTANSTASSTPPDFSFDDSVAPPRLVNTGTDHVAILKSLESYGNWLAAHRPDPALAPTTVAPGTGLLRDYLRDLTNLRDNNRREVERLDGPSEYTILSATPDAFSARVVENISAHQVVDPSGHVTSEARFSGPTTYLDLVVLAGGRWCLADIEIEHPVDVHL
jgi:hypothetical protein